VTVRKQHNKYVTALIIPGYLYIKLEVKSENESSHHVVNFITEVFPVFRF